ncbi:MAG: YggT family protein [Pedobacter sp.]|nr:YggT family protein [Pedobacter sp.]
MNAISQVSTLILTTAFDIYIVILWLRFLLQLLHADYYNPIAQFVVKATSPFVDPLRRIIPGNRSWEPSVLVLILLFKMIELTLVGMASGMGTYPPLLLVVMTVLQLLMLAADFYFWTLIISVVLSWVAPGSYSPAAVLVHQITEPLLAPCRRLLPAMGGIDLSPIIAFLGIQVFKILLGAAAMPLLQAVGQM